MLFIDKIGDRMGIGKAFLGDLWGLLERKNKIVGPEEIRRNLQVNDLQQKNRGKICKKPNKLG